MVLINFGGARTLDVDFPMTGTWYQMCDGVQATHQTPGLASINVTGGTHAISLPGNTAHIYMSANPVP